MKNKRELMKKAIDLARKGYGSVSPNPMVGAVITKQSRVIGEGFHKKAGLPHAEIEALNSLTEPSEGAEMYVNLEPCSHFGKTPPCTDAIIKAKIKKVYIAHLDPNPLVNGKGVEKLNKAGIATEIGICEKEAKSLNELFIHNVKNNQPFIGLKIAMTLDGKIADLDYNSKWITNESARKRTHHIRSGYDAIIAGAETIRRDNPQYTVRHVEGKNPYRIILSETGNIPENSQILVNEDNKTIILTNNEKLKDKFPKETLFMSSQGPRITPEEIRDILYMNGFHSLLIESGGNVSSQFLQSGLVNRVYLFYGPIILGPGKSPFDEISKTCLKQALKLENVNMEYFNDSFLVEGTLPQGVNDCLRE